MGKIFAKLALILSGCQLVLPASTARAAKKEKVREQVAVIDTNLGRIVFRFFDQESPKTVGAFKKLVQGGFYSGTLIHRVLPELLIEAGDPGTRAEDQDAPAVTVAPQPIEKNDLKHHPGTVSMGHSREDPTSKSEFFICLQDVGYFDGRHTVIGEVIEGLKVVHAISNVPRNAKQLPLFPVRIRRISLEEQEFYKEVK
jgi:cyclophilin family peptidyl-prolyl cis-trans isomerase